MYVKFAEIFDLGSKYQIENETPGQIEYFHQAYTKSIKFIRARALSIILLNDDLCLHIYELSMSGVAIQCAEIEIIIWNLF